MKKQSKKIIIFLVFVASFFLIDRGIYSLCLQAYRTVLRVESGGMVPEALEARAEFVVLGNSLARHHYVPSILEEGLGVSVYNLGADGQGIAYMRGVVDILLGDYLPEVLVLNISPGMLSVKKHSETMPRVTSLSPYLDESEVVREIIYSKGIFEKLKYISKAFRFNDQPVRYIYNALFSHPELEGLKGFSPIRRIFTPEVASKPFENWVLDPHTVVLLRAAVVQAKMRGVQVIFVMSPHYMFWHGNPESPLNELFITAQEIAEKEQIPFINITPLKYAQFKDHRLYADAPHLNYEGAKIFSRILVERILDDHLMSGR